MRISDWSSDVCSSDLIWLRHGTPDDFRPRFLQHQQADRTQQQAGHAYEDEGVAPPVMLGDIAPDYQASGIAQRRRQPEPSQRAGAFFARKVGPDQTLRGWQCAGLAGPTAAQHARTWARARWCR